MKWPGLNRQGFTLLELILALAIILIIASILFPALSRGKERARRTACANNIHQFIVAAQMYAHDNNDLLPRTDAFCTAMMTKKCLTNFIRYAGIVPVLDCPNLHERFIKGSSGWPTGWREQGLSVAIGYHYLAGQTDTPWGSMAVLPGGASAQPWKSPQKLSESGLSLLIADLNSCYDSMTVVPHARRGAAVLDDSYFRDRFDKLVLPAKAGAAGGNVGAMDGSVTWRAINTMTIHVAGREWNGQPYGWW
jgi:prepilin-type N-terminal cleavage/methylation domain-containing protein